MEFAEQIDFYWLGEVRWGEVVVESLPHLPPDQ